MESFIQLVLEDSNLSSQICFFITTSGFYLAASPVLLPTWDQSITTLFYCQHRQRRPSRSRTMRKVSGRWTDREKYAFEDGLKKYGRGKRQKKKIVHKKPPFATTKKYIYKIFSRGCAVPPKAWFFVQNHHVSVCVVSTVL